MSINKAESDLFIDRFVGKKFGDVNELTRYIINQKINLKTLKDIISRLKELKVVKKSVSNMKKNDIVTLLSSEYSIYINRSSSIVEKVVVEKVVEEVVDNQNNSNIKKFVINKKGHEIIVLTTEEDAKSLQASISEEDSLERRLIDSEKREEKLLETIKNLSDENKKLKEKLNCTKDYKCVKENEKCNIASGNCEPSEEDNGEDNGEDDGEDEDIVEFVSTDGNRYTGNKAQIEKLRTRLATQNSIISNSIQELTIPESLDDVDETLSLARSINEVEQSDGINEKLTQIRKILSIQT